MIDPFGATLSVISLVGCFNDCVELFEYVRAARNLGRDYEMYLLKLEFARLRFTRWGAAMGLANGDGSATSIEPIEQRLSVEDFNMAKKTLGFIEILFRKVEMKSKRHQARDAEDPMPATEPEFEDNTLRDLRNRARTIVLGRQKRSTVLQKVRWTVYEKKEFEHLLHELSDNVSMLVEIAPAEKQKVLCQAEVREIDVVGNSGALQEVLRPSADGVSVDDMLRESIIESLQDGGENSLALSFTNNVVHDGASIDQGDRVAGSYQGQVSGKRDYSADNCKFGKGSSFRQGITIGGDAAGLWGGNVRRN